MANSAEKKGLLDAIKSDASPEAASAISFLHKHAKLIASLVLAVVLIALLALGYQWYHSRQLSARSSELGGILIKQEGAERIAALEAFLQKTPSEFKPAVYFEIAFTATRMKDYAKAAEAWKAAGELLAPNAPMLASTGLGLASALDKSGQPAEGVKVLEDLLTKVNAEQHVVDFIKMELAALAESAGQWDRSIALYEELAKNQTGEGKNFFAFRAAELRGKHPEAAKPAANGADAK